MFRNARQWDVPVAPVCCWAAVTLINWLVGCVSTHLDEYWGAWFVDAQHHQSLVRSP